MQFESILCLEFFIMLYFLMPFAVALGFVLVATNNARKERGLAEERNVEEAHVKEEKEPLIRKDDGQGCVCHGIYCCQKTGVIAPPNSPTGY